MPYRRTYKKKRYKPKKRYSVDAKQNAKIKKLQRMVYSQQQAKYIDVFTALTSVNSTGYLTQTMIGLDKIPAAAATVSGAVVPSTNYTRIGNKINLKKLECRFHMVNSNSDMYNRIRVICFTLADPDTSSGLGAPTIGDILETTSNIKAFYKKNSKYKYKILYDKTHATGGAITAAVIPGFLGDARPISKDFTMKLKWPKGLPVHYKSSGPGVPEKMQIWFLFISDSLGTNHPRLSCMSRLNFDP